MAGWRPSRPGRDREIDRAKFDVLNFGSPVCPPASCEGRALLPLSPACWGGRWVAWVARRPLTSTPRPQKGRKEKRGRGCHVIGPARRLLGCWGRSRTRPSDFQPAQPASLARIAGMVVVVVVGLAAGWPRPPGSGDLAYTICSPRHHLLIEEGSVSGQCERFATLLEVWPASFTGLDGWRFRPWRANSMDPGFVSPTGRGDEAAANWCLSIEAPRLCFPAFPC